MEVWRAHYDKTSNEEFPWDRNSLTNVSPVCGPSEKISALEVCVAIGKMQRVLRKLWQRCSRLQAKLVAYIVNDVCNVVVNVYKGKGDPLSCGSYRGIKLSEHAMKVLERVIEGRVRKIVKIDNMQFGFLAGWSTTDAIFIVRQLQEKYLAKSKDLWMAFVDLEKAFDRVPREVVCLFTMNKT